MYIFAMDLGWNRVPILLILLIFWKHAAGHKGWSSQDLRPQRKGPVHKVLSPRGAQSSVLEAPVTGSIPFEEVASNVLAGKSLNANRSPFSLSRQYVKGGVSSSYESMSRTQSAPSASVSASVVLPQNQHSSDGITSLLQLQGSFSPSVQDIANQTGYQLVTSSPLSATSNTSTGSSAISLSKFTYTSPGSSRPHEAGSSSQLVSTHGLSGLLQSLPSSTASQNIPWSSAYIKLAASPLGVGQSTSGQSSYSQYTSGSQSRAGTQLAASRQYVPTSFQPEVATSQFGSALSLGAKVPVSSRYYPAAQSGSSLSQSQPFQMWQPSTSTTKGLQASSRVSQGFQTSGASQSVSLSHSRLFSLSSASTDPASTLQLQGTSSQYAPAAFDSKVPVQSSAPSRGSKAPSRFSTITSASPGQFASTQTGSTFTDGSSLQLQGTSSQYTPAAKVPVYNQAALSGSSLSLSQPSQLKPSTSTWSQGFQTSGTVTSQSSSLSQVSKAPSRFSTQYSPAYAKYGSSFIDSSSQATSDPSSFDLHASSSRSRVGTQLAGSSLVPTQTGSTPTDGSSLQLQGTSSQYTPAALAAKVPVYNQAALSGSSLSLSQPSQLKPSTSRWSQGFQTSGTVTSQSRSRSQGSKAPSRFSTLISAASPGQFASPQEGGGRYSGLSSQFQSASSHYSPGSPAYAKYGSSLLDVFSQSTIDQSASDLYASSSQSRTDIQLTGSSRYVPTQTGNAFTDASLQLQGTSSQYAPALATKVPVSSQAAPSGSFLSLSQPSQLKPPTSRWSQGFQAPGTVVSQGFQTFGTATSQSSSVSQGSKAPSRFSTQYSPAYAKYGSSLIDSSSQATSDQSSFDLHASSSQSRVGTPTDGSSLQLQGTSSQYTPAALAAKVPVYNRAPSGSSFSLSQPSQLKPSTSRWSQGFKAPGTVVSQGFQTFGTATSQSSSVSQGSKAPSRFSTLTSAASPGQFASMQEGSGKYSGLSSQFQSASSQYRPGSPAYVKHVSSLQLQGTSSQYTPAALVAKMPEYNRAPPSGSSFSLSQPSQLKPSTSRWSQGFQTSDTVTSQSSSLSQGSKAPSRFSTQYSPAYAKYGSSFIDSSSQATSDPSSFDLHASSSQSRVGTQLAGSSLVPTQTGSTPTDGSSLQLQGTSSQYTPAALAAKVPVYNRAPSGSSFSLSQPSQLKPSTSRWSQGFKAPGTVVSQGFQTFGTATSQSSSVSQGSKAPSRFSTLTSAASPGQFASTQTGSTFTDGSSLPLQGTSSQYTPAAWVSKVPVYNRAPPSGSSFSLSQPSQLKPSTSSWSQGFQASGTVTSQSSSSQGSKVPSRFSTLTSASPGQLASTQEGNGRSSGLSSQLLSASSQYRPGSPAYVKHGSSLQLQGTSSQYTPAALVAKLVEYSRAPSGSSSSLSQPSQLKPSTSRWSQGFQASGKMVSQSSSPFQDAKAPSRISVLTPAASPGQFASMQEGSGRYSGLSSQFQSALSQYRPGSPAYAKHGSSLLDVSSQSTSDQSASALYASSSQSRTDTPLAGSSHYVPTQTGSTFTDGSSLQLQGTSSLYAPVAVVAKVPVYSQVTPSGSLLSQLLPSASSWSQGFQASGTETSQSSSSLQTPQFSSGSFMPTLSPPMDSVAQSSQSFGSVIRRQMSPGLFASVQHPTGSVTSGSNVQAASQGMFSGQSSDSTSVISSSYASTYDQKPLGYSRPSQSSSASGRYSSVKG